MKKIFIFLSFLFLFQLSQKTIFAAEDPLSVPNNKFGIHIIDENDLDDAANLVNSNGGDWGYVTMVIREDEMNNSRWQKVFDNMRRLHLIPILRIATIQKDSSWEKPDINRIGNWIDFLNSLNWVVKNRYVIIGNEPNHASEWGGEVKPEEYADYFYNFSKKLKESNSDYFVLPAALDASAPNNTTHLSEETFITWMLKSNIDVFKYAEGWNSHSYPNPGFSGEVSDKGRATVKNYIWEQSLLKKLKVDNNFPIFVTETGWQLNRENNEDKIAENMTKAFNDIWNDQNIVAITPFILNYQAEPFANFSWKKTDGTFYKIYDEVKNISKIAGSPIQIHSGKKIATLVPTIIKKSQVNLGIAIFENTGQSIWSKGQTDKILNAENAINNVIPIIGNIEPKHKGIVFYFEQNP